MSVTSVIIELPECEECGSRMKFFDQVWIEDEYMLVASILCVNPQCVNSSVVHIQAAEQSVQPTGETCANCGRPLVNGVCNPCFAPQASDFVIR